MRQKRVEGMNFRLLHREAGEVLAQDANRLKLIEAAMICLTPLTLYLLLTSTWRTVLLPMLVPGSAAYAACAIGFWSLLLLLTQFFTFPLLCGLLGMSAAMEAGEQTDLTELFAPFRSGGSYRRALRISFCVLWRLCVLLLAECAVLLVLRQLENRLLILLLGIPAMLAVAVLLFWWFCGGFLHAYLVLCRPAAAERMRPYARSVGLRYWGGYLPWLALSLLTFCILLLADVLPRMLISYFRLCRKLNEMTTNPEDKNHE